MQHSPTRQSSFSFLQGGGEMGQLMRAKEWSGSAVGTPDKWPQSLRTTLSILLNSKFPMFLFWGPELVCFYNDAYRPSLGNKGKHPDILGGRGEDYWQEIWAVIKPLIDQVLAGGEATWSEDQLIPIYRNGKMEDVYWTFSYSPVNDESGSPAGVFVTCNETTEKVKTLRRVEESEQRFRTMAEATEILIAMSDETGNATYFNKAWADLTGRATEDLLQFGWVDMIHAEDREIYVNIYLKAFEKKTSFTGEFRVLNKEGHYRWVLAKGSPRFGSDGSFAGYISSCIDITERRQAEEEREHLTHILAANEERLNIIISASVLGTWELNLKTREIKYSDRYLEILGYEKGLVLSHEELLKRLHPDDLMVRQKAFEQAFLTGILHYESRTVWSDGSLHWIEGRGKVFYDEQGEPFKMMGTARDITEEKDYQQELLQREQKFRVLADSMPQFVWTGDGEGNLNYFNRAVYDYSGLTAEQIARDGWLQIVHPDDREENINAWMHSIRTGSDFIFEHRFGRHDGEYRWQLSRAIPQRDADGNIQMWVGSSTDIQEIKEQDQQKDYFISMASHELKTPITSIKGYVQILQRTYQNGTDNFLKNSLKIIDKQIITLTGLIGDLLDLSKIKSGSLVLQKDHFEITELIQDVIDEITHIDPEYSISFAKKTPVVVYADKERIGQVLINFLTNAIKYSPNSRNITVKNSTAEDHVMVSVEDAGIGISKTDQEKIFERFYRAEGKNEKTFPGFGIGLFIAAEIIRRHDGNIGVSSEPGKGSVFYFSIPFTK